MGRYPYSSDAKLRIHANDANKIKKPMLTKPMRKMRITMRMTRIETKRISRSQHSHEFIDSHRSSGFTLIEMIVSIALFSFVMLAVTTVLLSVVDANHKAQGLKTAINNLSLSLESITRNLRTGTGYSKTGFGLGSGCPGTSKSGINFMDHNGTLTMYYLETLANGSGAIMVKKGDSLPGAMTASEINIDRLCFYVSGEGNNDATQPRVLITIGGEVSSKTVVGAKTRTTSRFDIETLVSQRFPDVTQN